MIKKLITRLQEHINTHFDGTHTALSGVTANQHHNQVHTITGTDHTGNLALSDITPRTHATLTSIGVNDHHNETHILLSTVHSDSLAGTVLRGDIIIGNSTPAWSRLTVGSANSVLWTDGTDPSWSTAPRLANIADTGGTNRITTLTTSPQLTLTGNVVTSGYLRVGTASAPLNTTNGDLTTSRILIGTDTAFASNAKLYVVSDITPAIATNHTFINAITRPDGSPAINHTGLNFTHSIIPSALSSHRQTGLQVVIQHASGAFGLNSPSAMIGLNLFVTQNVASTTVNTANLVRGTLLTIQGTITTANIFDMVLGSAGNSGTITNCNFFNASTNATTVNTITTLKGINILDIVQSNTVTNFIGLDIAQTTTATTINLGIRNASPTAFTPSTQQSIAVTAPIVANATIVQISTTTAANMTATPTIANGQDGQILVIINTGTNTFTLQDQGTLASSNLRLVGTTFACATRDNITLMYNVAIGDWVEVARSNVT